MLFYIPLLDRDGEVYRIVSLEYDRAVNGRIVVIQSTYETSWPLQSPEIFVQENLRNTDPALAHVRGIRDFVDPIVHIMLIFPSEALPESTDDEPQEDETDEVSDENTDPQEDCDEGQGQVENLVENSQPIQGETIGGYFYSKIIAGMQCRLV